MPSQGDPTERVIMVPFDARESLSIAVAAKLSAKAPNTIRLWAERYGIGRKIGGDWHISRVALQIFLDGDTATLSAYHAGNRTDARALLFRTCRLWGTTPTIPKATKPA